MDDIDILDLIEQGYDFEAINDELLDAGYDEEDIAEAWADTGYDWQDALYDAIADQAVDLEDLPDYADMLDMDVSEAYDLYYGYGDDNG